MAQHAQTEVADNAAQATATRPLSFVNFAGDEMALLIEMVVDLSMN